MLLSRRMAGIADTYHNYRHPLLLPSINQMNSRYYNLPHHYLHTSSVASSTSVTTASPTTTTTSSSSDDDRRYRLYANKRRFQSFGLSALAGGQVLFWGYAAGQGLSATSSLSAITSDTASAAGTLLISPVWTIGGLGLSLLFSWMVTAYLRRMVAYIDLLNLTEPVIRVTPHSVLGRLGKAVDIHARDLIQGPMHKDKDGNRHWTFGIRKNPKSKMVFYYIVDMKRGVVDRDALASIVDGPDNFVAWSYKRDAGNMKQRWKHWKNGSGGGGNNNSNRGHNKQQQQRGRGYRKS